QAMMERRYEAYKTHVVKPFFREHITRLDRQIVLIDAMQALNAGPAAMADLERAVTEILACFRPGRGNFLTDLFSRRIDRILVAATKADHLHHESHDRLQAIVRRLADRAVARANFTGADVDVVALAAVRATREGTVKQGRETLPVIIGTPLKGERINGDTFDGKTETAIFPGDLPDKVDTVFDPSVTSPDGGDPAIRFVRFRPPKLERTAEGVTLSLPHIRLDRALQFLIGDHLA
ncbi:YcjX family protein, partial [Mesorhizobium sp.]